MLILIKTLIFKLYSDQTIFELIKINLFQIIKLSLLIKLS
jgi:hypothetical protein